MRGVGERASEILTAYGVRPFQDYAMRWRISPDVNGELLLLGTYPDNPDRYSWTSDGRYFGFPIDVDPSLPPNSMLFERAAEASL